MSPARLALVCALALAAVPAHATVCHLAVEANDAMQFSQRKLAVAPECTEVELTLTHVGKQPAQIMGHNWVLVRSGDVAAVAAAGQAAGRSHDYQPPGDKRVLAATRVVGGGESATVSFSTANLRAGDAYTFFCSTPGHGSVMRGALEFRDVNAHQMTAAAAVSKDAR